MAIVNNSLTEYNKIKLGGNSQEQAAFNDMLKTADPDVIAALQFIDSYGLNISFAELETDEIGNNINGQAAVGGDLVKLDDNLLQDKDKLKNVFAHELAHILGASHETSDKEDKKFDVLEALLTNGKDDGLQSVFEQYKGSQATQDTQNSVDSTMPKPDTTPNTDATSSPSSASSSGTGGSNGGVSVSEMATSSNGEGSFSSVKEGDQMVMTVSYSKDHGVPDLEQLKKDGWTVEYNKGASNGKKDMKEGEGDLATMVITKTAGANESSKYKIPTTSGKDDLSTQSFSVSGGKIDIDNIAEHAGDSKGQKTTIDANDNKDAAFYLNVASADDPANYKQESIKGDSGIVSFGSSVAGDDAGASWITKDNDGSSIEYGKVGGGDNDQGLSIAIVAN